MSSAIKKSASPTLSQKDFTKKLLPKNSSPKQLATYAAAAITGFFILIGAILALFTSIIEATFSGFLIMTFACFISSYLIIFYSLQRYIYRRVRLIYKNIHRLKLASTEKMSALSMDRDIFSEVEKEVSDWAVNKEAEIESLRKMAAYRRTFLGNISHELKTPLFNIQGYLHTLLEGGLYDEKINFNYLSRAATNVDRLQTIVQGLDAISQMESGQLKLQMVDFDIKTLTQEVFEDLERNAEKRHIRLSFKEGAASNYLVKGDRESIRQVLTNLINNAIKYGKENGKVKLGFYDMDSNVLVEVADNGIGIEESHLDHLFDRFYRVDSSRSREEGGSGLGLSIVKHLIEAHKQTVHVRSKKGLGTTFGFTLEKA